MRFYCSVLMIGLLALPAVAAPVLDGIRDGSYNLRAVQTLETQFGDANPNSGSELDAAWAQFDGGVLYLMLTGNLENNFNKLNVFIDSVPGGQNQLQADANSGGNNPENDGWANKHAGFMFDAGFEADYLVILRNGNFGGDRFDIDYAVIGGGLGAFQNASFVFGSSLTGSNAAALPNGIGVAHDRSNTAGVVGGTGAANQAAAAAVTTGIELAIPLSAIGNPNLLDIKVSAMINGSNHDYLSNQFLGGLPTGLGNAPDCGGGLGTGNLGGDGACHFTGNVAGINLKNFAGDQFFTVVPEPSTWVLFGLALATAVCGRRR